MVVQKSEEKGHVEGDNGTLTWTLTLETRNVNVRTGINCSQKDSQNSLEDSLPWNYVLFVF